MNRQMLEVFALRASVAVMLWLLLFYTTFADAVTNTAISNGNWNNSSIWDQNHEPISGEDVNVSTYNVVINTTTIPASGTLNSLTAGTGGYCSLALNTVGNTTINCTTLTAGSTALIQVSGTTSNTLTINSGTYPNGLVGGTGGSQAQALYHSSTGSVTIVGDCIGGSAGGSYGVRCDKAATITFNGNIYGGSTFLAAGVYWASVTGTATVNGNLINSSSSVAWTGKPCILNDTTYDIYWGTAYYGQEPLDHQLLSGISCGRITGNRVDATASFVLSTHSYGDPDSQTTGTWVAPTQSYVLNTHTYGVSGGTSGTFDLSLYTLISGIVSASDVRYGIARYSGGSTGTCYVPDPSNVWFGTNVDATTGTKRASSITNCSAGNVKNGVTIDDVSGTYTGVIVIDD